MTSLNKFLIKLIPTEKILVLKLYENHICAYIAYCGSIDKVILIRYLDGHRSKCRHFDKSISMLDAQLLPV